MNDTMTTSAELIEVVRSFQKSRIILTAFELDLFTIIERGAKNTMEIAEKSSTNPDGIERLLNALTAMGLIRKEINSFHNTEISSEFLVKGNRPAR